jgi:peptidoglycan/LPS O-acetylase OafA/YrhL
MHPWFRRGENTAIFNSLAYSLNLLILGGLFVWAALSDGADRADGRKGSLLARGLSHPVLRGLGRISYMFYLLHLGALMLASRYFGTLAAAGVAFAGTVAVATLSWFAVEKPILSLSASHRRAAPQVPAVGG